MQVGWPTVWEDYRDQEEGIWRPLYTQRGFRDWWEWRATYFADLSLPFRTWQRITIDQPERVIPTWFVAGYPGIKKYRPAGEDFTTLATVAASPDVAESEKVQKIVRSMRPLKFILLRSGGEVAVLDGFHRGVAATLCAMRGATIPEVTAYETEIERLLFDAFCRERPLVTK